MDNMIDDLAAQRFNPNRIGMRRRFNMERDRLSSAFGAQAAYEADPTNRRLMENRPMRRGSVESRLNPSVFDPVRNRGLRR